jgi:hypothetical protein
MIVADHLHLEIAPGADLTAAPGTWPWVDITERVRHQVGVTITGVSRADESVGADIPSLTITVANDDGDFSSRNPLAPWFPKLGLGTPIRVYWDTPDNERFLGFISELPPRWVGDKSGTDAVVLLRADGITRRVRQGEQALQSALRRSVERAPGVVAYWPMEDGNDASQLASPMRGVAAGSFGDEVQLAVDDHPAGSKALPELRPDSSFGVRFPVPFFRPGHPNRWAANWVFKIEDAVASFRTACTFRTSSSEHAQIRVRVSTTQLLLEIRNSDGDVTHNNTVSINQAVLGEWVHFRLDVRGTVTLIYDLEIRGETGVALNVISGDVGGGPPTQPTQVGILDKLASDVTRRIGHFAITPAVRFAGQQPGGVFDYLGMTGYHGERAAARFARLCDEERLRCEVVRDDLDILNENPGFETDTSGWNFLGGTLTRSTEQSFAGVASGRFEPSGTVASPSVMPLVPVPAEPSETYEWSVWVLAETTNRVFVFIVWFDDNEDETHFKSESIQLTPGQWTRLSVRDQSWPGDAFLNTSVRYVDTPTTADVIFIDEAILTKLDDTERMGPQRPLPLSELLREVGAADGGVLHDGDGGYVYRTRSSMYNQDAALEPSVPAGQLSFPPEPTDDDQQTRNDITVTRASGSSSRAIDDTHIARHGRYEDSVEVNVAADGQTAPVANWRLGLGTVDEYRWPQINLALHKNPELIPDWLATRIGDRIVVDHEIDQIPGVEVDQLVQGWVERFDQFRWDVELNCSPASPWNHLFTLDDDTDGRLESNAYLAEGITEAQTTIPVLVPVTRALNLAADFEQEFAVQSATGTLFVDWFVSSGSSLSRSTVRAFRGLASARFDGGTSSAPLIRSNRVPVATGLEYRSSVWCYSESGGFRALMRLRFHDRTGALITPESTADVLLPAGEWTRLTVATPAPPGAAEAEFRVETWDAALSAPVSEVMWVDDAEVGVQGPPFITDAEYPAMFPFGIKVGGEVMTVTGVGAADANGVQQFTVVRAVNDISKAHQAGSDVRLSPSPRLAL